MAKHGDWIPKLVVVGAVAVVGVFMFPTVLGWLKKAGGSVSATGQPQQPQKSSGGGAGSGSSGGPGGSSGNKLTDLLSGFLNGSLITSNSSIQNSIDTLSNHGFGQWWDSIQVPDFAAPTFDFSTFDFYSPGTQGAMLNDALNLIPVATPTFTGTSDYGTGGGGYGGGGGDTGGDWWDVGYSSEEGL